MNWRARTSVKRLVVAAASARPFVRAAAAAGYEVIAADVFCDEDTRRDAFEAVTLGYVAGGFDPAEIRKRLIPLLAGGDTGFIYGSGFETQPDLLEEIAAACPVFGNSAATVEAVKSPIHFFSSLRRYGIPYPEISPAPPPSLHGWLGKRRGGSGGTHVVTATSASAQDYYQRQLPGRPCALLFLADGRDIIEIGCHEQWLAPTVAMPYRYGGAVSQISLPAGVRAGMVSAARRLTVEFGLRGLNSLDCMVAGECWWVLEVNPRLSASFSLYDTDAAGTHLLQAHLDACNGRLAYVAGHEMPKAHLIYYATRPCIIPSGLQWPEWVSDVPSAGTRIECNAPLCSISSSAESVGEVRLQTLRRIGMLAQFLKNHEPG